MVLDASALVAFLHDERGSDRVAEALDDAVVSAVNWAEVVQKSLQRQVNVQGMGDEFREIGIRFEPFTSSQAEIAAELWQSTRRFGLSLADRACLALALERAEPALTADRTWKDLELGIEIIVVR